MEKTNCNLCKSDNFVNLHTITRNGFTFKIVKCAKCSFCYMNPIPSESEIKKLYDKNYFHRKGFDPGVDYALGLKQKKSVDNLHINRLINIESKINKKNKILLDIGCGFGEFLDCANKRGWKTTGVELSPYSTNIARKKFNLNIHLGTLDSAKFKKRSFDAITMLELIEHLPDPFSALKKCHDLLADKGMIIIQTGDINGLYAKLKGKNWPYFLGGHLVYFSKKTLSVMLEKTGFEVIHVYNGDEISLGARSKLFWYYKNKKKFINWIEYFKFILIFFIRKIGFGGMTIYARKK